MSNANFALIPGGPVEARFLMGDNIIERKGAFIRLVGMPFLEKEGPDAGRLMLGGRLLDEEGELVVFDLNPELVIETYDEVTEEEHAAYMAGREGN